MNYFEIDYLKRLTLLLKEAFKFKKYKAMSPFLAVLCGILMLPFVAISFSLVAFFAVLAFFFTIIIAPIKFLHLIVNTEGKEIKHATQAIVYLISWPLVFLLYALMSFLLFLLLPTYALLSFFTYVWSFGGFKFHLFITKNEDISIDVKGRYNALPVVFILVAVIVLILLPLIACSIHMIDAYSDPIAANLYDEAFAKYMSAAYKQFTASYPISYIAPFMGFALLYTLIGMARFPKEREFKEVKSTPSVQAVPVIVPDESIANDNINELKKYKELLDMGILTQEEFDTRKKQILEGWETF